MADTVKRYVSRFGIPAVAGGVWLFVLLYTDFFSGLTVSLYTFSLSQVTIYVICGIFATLCLLFPPFYGEKQMGFRLLWAVVPLGLPFLFRLMSIHFFWALTLLGILLFLGGVCLFLTHWAAKRLWPGKASVKKRFSVFWTLYAPVWGGMMLVICFLFLCFPYPDGVTPSSVTPSNDLVAEEGSLTLSQKETVEKLEETVWNTLSEKEKLNVLQVVLNIETTYLGIHPVVLCSDESMRGGYLGVYLSEEERIHINREYLRTASPQECVQTICHEARHAYQQSVVDALDWDKAEVSNNRYFKEAAVWREEFSGYVSGFEDYENYYGQTVETDAREYASQATEVYFEFVKSLS